MFYTTALWHVHVIGLTMDDNEVKSVEVEQQVKCFQPGERSQGGLPFHRISRLCSSKFHRSIYLLMLYVNGVNLIGSQGVFTKMFINLIELW